MEGANRLTFQVLLGSIAVFFTGHFANQFTFVGPLFLKSNVKQEKRFSNIGIYDPEGRKIKIIYNHDGTLSFSANSTDDIQQVATALAKTRIGLKTLMLTDAAFTKITLEVDTVNIIESSDGNVLAAETSPIISTPVNERSKPVGAAYISSAKIVIYEAAIKDIAGKNSGKLLIHGFVVEMKNYTVSDIVASYAIHEFVHVLDEQFSGSLNPTATKAEIESKPYEIQLQHLNELQEQKNLQ
jgi:hypothetical protein